MTSPNIGLRRPALVVLALGAALGTSACSAGQVSQTASQVAAVNGGQGSVGDLVVNNLQVVMPESGEGEATVGFVASFDGTGTGESVTLDRVEIAGEELQLGEAPPLERGCSIVYSADQSTPPPPVPQGVCVEHTTAALPTSDGLHIGTSAPATVTYSNGDQIEMLAGIVAVDPLPAEGN